MGPQQRLKRSLCRDGEYRGCRCDRTGPCNGLSKHSELFRFLAFGAELAELKILASKICLSRSPFDYKNRGAGLALQLGLHFRCGPNAADLPNPIVNKFLLLSRPAKRLHHMHGIQNAAVNPRCYRIIVSPVLRAGIAL